MRSQKIIYIFILLSSSMAYGNDYDAKNNGVLILGTTPEFLKMGCVKTIVMDDAADEYYYRKGNKIPDGYCKLEVGMQAIPIYEDVRKKRGMPPGSYINAKKKLNRLREEVKEKQNQSKRLKLEMERIKRAKARDPNIKKAYESIDYLFKYNIQGVVCSKDFTKLDKCYRGKYTPPVSGKKCLKYLRVGGYDDPCPSLAPAR